MGENIIKVYVYSVCYELYTRHKADTSRVGDYPEVCKTGNGVQDGKHIRFRSKLSLLLQIKYWIESEAFSTVNGQSTIITDPSEVFIIFIVLVIWIYSLGRYRFSILHSDKGCPS